MVQRVHSFRSQDGIGKKAIPHEEWTNSCFDMLVVLPGLCQAHSMLKANAASMIHRVTQTLTSSHLGKFNAFWNRPDSWDVVAVIFRNIVVVVGSLLFHLPLSWHIDQIHKVVFTCESE